MFALCYHKPHKKKIMHRGKLGLTRESSLKNHDLPSKALGQYVATKLTSKFRYPAILRFMSGPTEVLVGICYTSILFITDFDTSILLQHTVQ